VLTKAELMIAALRNRRRTAMIRLIAAGRHCYQSPPSLRRRNALRKRRLHKDRVPDARPAGARGE